MISIQREDCVTVSANQMSISPYPFRVRRTELRAAVFEKSQKAVIRKKSGFLIESSLPIVKSRPIPLANGRHQA